MNSFDAEKIMFELNPFFIQAMFSEEAIEWDVDAMFDQQVSYLCM